MQKPTESNANEIIKAMEEEDFEFLRLIGRYNLAISLTKYCARNCDLFNDTESPFLSLQQLTCIKKCSENISLTFPKFAEKVNESLLLGNENKEDQ